KSPRSRPSFICAASWTVRLRRPGEPAATQGPPRATAYFFGPTPGSRKRAISSRGRSGDAEEGLAERLLVDGDPEAGAARHLRPSAVRLRRPLGDALVHEHVDEHAVQEGL